MTLTFLNFFQLTSYHLYCLVSDNCKQGRCNQFCDNRTFVADAERTWNHRSEISRLSKSVVHLGHILNHDLYLIGMILRLSRRTCAGKLIACYTSFRVVTLVQKLSYCNLFAYHYIVLPCGGFPPLNSVHLKCLLTTS